MVKTQRKVRRSITTDQLIMLLEGLDSAKIVSFIAKTVPQMLKTNNPYYGDIVKLANVNGIINWSYKHAVDQQRIREGKKPDFEPLPRAWGHRVPGQPFVEHNGNLYLEVKIERLNEESQYFYKGRRIKFSKIEKFLSRKNEGTRQGLENPVILRDYNILTVQTFTMDHTIYVIGEGD
jgi:hypothetical protein